MKELQQFVNELSAWADRTFPETSNQPLPKLYHLKKEVNELIDAIENNHAPHDINEEFADCFILLIQAIHRNGLTMDAMLTIARLKFIKLQSRQWGPPDEHGACQHIKPLPELQFPPDQFTVPYPLEDGPGVQLPEAGGVPITGPERIVNMDGKMVIDGESETFPGIRDSQWLDDKLKTAPPIDFKKVWSIGKSSWSPNWGRHDNNKP